MKKKINTKQVKSKYHCFSCGNGFNNKKEFIEHLKSEFDDATSIADTAIDQLADLGITSYS